MALTRRLRATAAVHAFLGRVGVLDQRKILARPMAQRMAMRAPALLVGPVPSVRTEDHRVPTRDGETVRVRVYVPGTPTTQPLLYLHGGGFAVGGIDSCDHICRRLAHESGAVVASVEYRLAPDHPFPVPLHDSLDAADWFLTRADDLGVDPGLLVVGGDSAGGNLAAAAAVVLRDQGRPLAGQLLVYPGVDLSLSMPGVTTYTGVGLTTQDVRLLAATYLAGHDATDPYASPWYADAAGLAPALVVTAVHDPLHDEGVAYVEKLRAAGVPAQLLDLPDHAHGTLSVPRLSRGIDDVYARVVAFLRSVSLGQPA